MIPHTNLPREFFLPDYGRALRAAASKSRLWDPLTLRRLLEPLFQKLVPDDGREKSGDRWNDKCKAATAYHIAALVQDKVFTPLSDESDSGNIGEIYEYSYYDRWSTGKFPSVELTSGFLKDLDAVTQKRGELLYTQSSETLDYYYTYGGRSEFRNSEMIPGMLYVKFVLSDDPFEQAIAKAMELIPLPVPEGMTQPVINPDREAAEIYAGQFIGQAVARVRGKELFIVSPWIPKFNGTPAGTHKFLVDLESRLARKRYFLCAPLGFRKYHRQYKRWPWDPQKRSG